jgi:tRNA-specific 2-thiouridylase
VPHSNSTSRWAVAEGPAAGDRVVMGLSGGVDSAVATLLLRDRGCEVIAITTQNFCLSDPRFGSVGEHRSCCGQDAIDAARELSAELGIQHLVIDVQDRFRADVIDDYVASYVAGRTPSPCVRCNRLVRFPGLQRIADQVGAGWLATGHYARVLRHRSGSLHVGQGLDPGKDQSYFLYRLSAAQLERTSFPLGGLHKEEVRELARARGLPVAESPESQELCFVPDGDREPLLKPWMKPGPIVDRAGQTLGTHAGIGLYTVGQRRGLRLGGGPPRYVVAIDAARNAVVVGDESELARRKLRCSAARLSDPHPGEPGLWARSRYRHRGIPVRALEFSGAVAVGQERPEPGEVPTMHVTLERADRAPAPGQALVVYRDEAVVGGGTLMPWDASS